MFSRLTGSFGLLALVLVCVGLYGTMSYFVARRTSEIGIRMALGAQPARVFRMVLGEGLLLTGAGVVVGLAGAYFGTKLIATTLYQVPALDPLTFVSVAARCVSAPRLDQPWGPGAEGSLISSRKRSMYATERAPGDPSCRRPGGRRRRCRRGAPACGCPRPG